MRGLQGTGERRQTALVVELELWIVAREVTNNLQKDETLLLLDSKTGLKVTFK
jgi:hypothetical protein